MCHLSKNLFFHGILTIRYRPCKTRKIKCDEAKPSCVNCQKQGETCDYNIRLNWGGRVKKKPEFGDVMVTSGTSRPSSRDSTTTPTPNMPVPPRSYTSQPSMIKTEEYHPLPPDVAYSAALQESSSQYGRLPQVGMRMEDYGRLPPDVSYAGTLPEPSLQY